MSKYEQAAEALRDAKSYVHKLLMKAPYKDKKDRKLCVKDVDERLEEVISYIEFMETYDPDAPENQ